MEINAEKLIECALRDGLREGVKTKLGQSYNNPIDKMLDAAIETHRVEFMNLLNDALKSCLGDREFRDNIKTSVRHTLAKTLVSRFGGELEKQVNVLKSDPATRARITLAIEEIVRDKVEA